MDLTESDYIRGILNDFKNVIQIAKIAKRMKG